MVDAGQGKREPALLYLYLKGMRNADSTTFRGFMFLESADHEWYNWGGTGLCMPQVAMEWLPRIFFRSVCASAIFQIGHCLWVSLRIYIMSVCAQRQVSLGACVLSVCGPASDQSMHLHHSNLCTFFMSLASKVVKQASR